MIDKKIFCNENSSKYITNPGSPLKEVFHGKVLPSGEIELVSDGFENIQEYIDSFEEETDIYNIIARVSNGEIDLLNARKGAFIDTIGMPKTYAEILQKVIDGQKLFESLPVEIKEKFDNDFNKWFAQIDDPDFMIKSGFYEKVSEVKEEGVKEE